MGLARLPRWLQMLMLWPIGLLMVGLGLTTSGWLLIGYLAIALLFFGLPFVFNIMR